jgi:hypothetical protein
MLRQAETLLFNDSAAEFESKANDDTTALVKPNTALRIFSPLHIALR